MNASSKNFLTLIFLALIWGSSYILMKRGLVSFSPTQVATLRLIISGIVLSPFLRKISKKDIPAIAIIAFLGTGLPTFIYPLAITRVDSTVVGIINSLTPVFTVVFGVLLFKTKIKALQIVGLLVSLLGAGILILYGNSDKQIQINTFALVAVLAPMFYGYSSNVLKSKLDHIQALRLTAITFALLFPIALIVLFSTNFIEVVQTDPEALKSLGFIAILAIVGTALALAVFNFLIKKTSAVYASSVTFLMPIVVLLWGVFDKENVGVVHLIGLVFILGGVYILNYLKK